ncbi:hypothetical protein GDO78_012901 [Eleutherodactylus coqui]|uniref:Uncharacterized protein n=1 Tax=Eleutherodactylus coqui TaxID=57060 RepID=A0A8J6EZ11_ELECQ|nr:hypothetical protein GDO78_012901 [Eleutherodactylus coqui]
MGRVLLQSPSHVTKELIWSFMHLSFMSVEVVFRVCDLLAVSLFAQERELCIFYFGRLIICASFMKSSVAFLRCICCLYRVAVDILGAEVMRVRMQPTH